MVTYQEIINNSNLSINEVSIIMLKRSCESAINRCMRKYANVCCDLTPNQLLHALMSNKEFWDEWVRLTEDWVKKGYINRDRPTIDRIDEEGHYESGNVQPLPHWLNVLKAKAKKCLIVTFNDNWQVEVQLVWGQEKALKKLGMSKQELTGEYRNQIGKVDLLFFNHEPDLYIEGLSLLGLLSN